MFGQQEWLSKAAVGLTAIPTYDDCDSDDNDDNEDDDSVGDDSDDDGDDEHAGEAMNRSGSVRLPLF